MSLDDTNHRPRMSLPNLPPRSHDSHKGDFGRLLLIGGSAGMAGSVALSGKAALRTGAGLVTLATTASSASIVAGFEPSYMTLSLPELDGRISAASAAVLANHVEQCDALACGPGLGRGRGVTQVVSWLYREADACGVFDADALNALAESPRGLQRTRGSSSGNAARIITPHLGELRRLVGDAKLDRSAAVPRAKQIATDHKIIVLLKGPGTLVTDGVREVINETGNPGMATGGTGDVLTGIIGSLLAQGMQPFEACVAGAHLHGAAGDLAAAELGQTSMIASDLLIYLPRAIQQYKALST